MRPIIIAFAASMVAGVMLAAACGDDTGGSTSSGTGAGGTSENGFGTGGCDTCIATACSSEIGTCQNDAGCAAWLACLRACPIGPNGDADQACEAACPVDGTVAAEGRDAIVACRRTGAGATCAECGASPATSSTSTGSPGVCTMPPIVDQTCQPAEISDLCIRCIQEECCDSYRDVFSAGPTGDLADCWLSCANGDVQCAEDCYDNHADGVPGFGNYRACITANCNEVGLCTDDRVNDCILCQREECSCEAASCWADVECHLLYECFGNCGTSQTCVDGCIIAHPGGAPLFDNLIVCSGQRCVQRCGTG